MSAAGKPALTVHATGNLTSRAEFGGRPGEVSYVEPFRIVQALRTLNQESARNNEQIEVMMEATHHGPTSFPVPVCFVEIGSGPKEWSKTWKDSSARCSCCSQPQLFGGVNAVGFGGTHHSAKHTRISLEGKYRVGHIVSRYAFESGITETRFQEAFGKTIGGCETALVDWKGLSGDDRRRLVQQLNVWRKNVVRI